MRNADGAASWPTPGSVTIAVQGNETVLVLAGAVDLAVVRDFERTTPAPPAVTAIDAGEVTVLSATAVSLMLQFLRSAGDSGRTVRLRRSNPHVDRVLALLDLTEVFPRHR